MWGAMSRIRGMVAWLAWGTVAIAAIIGAGPPEASASVLLGEPTLTAGGFTNSCLNNCVVGHDAPPTTGGLSQAPFDGVLVHWEAVLASTPGTSVQLRTYSLTSASQVTLRTTGSSIALAPNSAVASRGASTRTPIARGDSFGVISDGNFTMRGLNTSVAGARMRGGPTSAASPPDGSIESASGLSGVWLNLNADLESDVDRDGFGDESQDGCPTSAATQGPCPAAAATPAPVTQVIAPADAQVSTRQATAALDRRGRAISVRMTCPAARTRPCRGVVRALTAKAVRLRGARRKAQVVLGSGGYSGAAGRAMTARVALGATSRSLFVPGRKLGVQLQIAPVDGPVATKRVNLRKAKAKKRKR